MSKTSLKNHPKELWILGLAELCERFAYYGVAGLLVLYAIEYYQFPNEKATHIYAIFSGCAAFLPFIGGWIADRWNCQLPLFIGALINAIGCFLIATGSHSLLYLSLFLIVCGYGIFTPSLVSLLAYAYRSKPELRDAGFSIYYASINVGVLLALASLGTIAKLTNWHLAFFIAGLVQLLGLIPLAIYLLQNKETHHAMRVFQKESSHHKLTPLEKSRMVVIVLFCVISILFWVAYNQAFSSMSIFAHDYMNKQIGGVMIPEGVFLSSESLFLVILAPILATLYVKLQKKNRDFSAATKTALSFFFIAACFLVMMGGSASIPADATAANVSWGYLVGAYFLMAIGEMLLAPIGLSMVSRLAPPRYTALSVGLWYVCVGIAFYTGGLLAGFMEKMGGLFNFFSIFVIITIVPAILMCFLSKKLTKMSHLNPNAPHSIADVDK